MELTTLWFMLIAVLWMGYFVLEGFDFGVGILMPVIARDDRERRVIINTIGPLWDGNEVWLVTFGGALFAAFPAAYATTFSAFYLPFMLLLVALIYRAASLEFRSKVTSRAWRTMWDLTFMGASALAPLLMGTAVGNALAGLPIDERGVFRGTTADLLQPYPLAVGVLAATMFAMHGAIYLYLKTEGELHERLKGTMWTAFGIFLVTYIGVTMATLVLHPHALRNFEDMPALWALVALNVLAIANIPRAIHLGRPRYAFLSSSATIVALVVLFGAALFPNLVTSTLDPAYHLTIRNASSSESTLRLMGWIALLGMPMVLTYTGIVYWTFR
ncbi:MAG: cytochrome d ubiquinol oxidase subunit II, partial [Ilumatobacter sp.]|nr:cytochrome d ubiquinol oxidase subunit II [Ilumatobacter sp.]